MCGGGPSVPPPPPPPQYNLRGPDIIRLSEPSKQAAPKKPQVQNEQTVKRRGKRGLVIQPQSGYGVSIPGSGGSSSGGSTRS